LCIALKLLIATTNEGKLREIKPLLDGVSLDLVTLADWPGIEPPEENGVTFAENARLKARYYAEQTGLPTVAEDSGLEIDALGGAPGVESARFGGVESTYPAKFALLYSMLQSAVSQSRTARFVCALALVDDGQVVFEAEGVVEGEIASEPVGSGGFGYDPIFFYPPFGCTLAQAVDRKSAVSHRGGAFRKLRAYLQDTHSGIRDLG
jgi:XTP/dITP diphosphohydrolase